MLRRFILCLFLALSAFTVTHAASPVTAVHASTTVPPTTTCTGTPYDPCGYPCTAPGSTGYCGYPCSASDPTSWYYCGYGAPCTNTATGYPCGAYCSYGGSIYPCSYPCVTNNGTYNCGYCNGQSTYGCSCPVTGAPYACGYPCSITPGAVGCGYNCGIYNGAYNCGPGCTTASIYGCYGCTTATAYGCGYPCTVTGSTNFCGYPCTYVNAAYPCQPVIYPCTGISLPAGCTVIYPTVPTTPPPPSVPVVNGVPVTFSPGYNMVGGPTGTDLSQAAVAYSFANGQYSSGSKSVTACQGYFAYFTTSTVIGLPGTSTGPTQTCHLAAGWNLLGNPFSGTATLPAGTIGYYWSPSTGSYSQVSVIPQGGAVFVYSDTVRDVTLTYGAVAGHSTSVVTITDSTIGPVTVHVGDQIQVIFTHPNAEVVSFDSLYFKGIAGGTTYPSTCYNPNFCVVSVSSLSWTGQAQVAGTTSLTFSPVCYSNSPSGCLFNPHAVQVNIQP